MKAAVCREFKKPLVVEDVTLASPAAGEIRVKVSACALCHSDIHYAEGAWGGRLPAVYGHEAAGVVEDIGAGVTGCLPGDHVVVTLIRACDRCYFCDRGMPVACASTFPLDETSPLTASNGGAISQGLRTGAFAEYVLVHESQAVVIPRDMPLDSASLLACGVITGFGAAVNTAQVELGSSVAVIGIGGVGLNSLQGAAFQGAEPIIAIDVSDAKLQAAGQFGATHTVNSGKQDLPDAVRAATGGRGADYVFVTVGAKEAVEQALAAVAPTGAVVLVGMPATGVTVDIDPGTIADLNQRILGSKMGSARIHTDIPMLIDLYRAGRLKLDELISGRYALSDINEAIASVKRGEALRNVIVF
ncbi:MAG: Zn-dependent alcohol dehydrogenase [Rhodospirillales bacterium]|nr:MAG: Zn-dependent alcohol dehydrogenase [Rhodospirillales bacterium]